MGISFLMKRHFLGWRHSSRKTKSFYIFLRIADACFYHFTKLEYAHRQSLAQFGSWPQPIVLILLWEVRIIKFNFKPHAQILAGISGISHYCMGLFSCWPIYYLPGAILYFFLTNKNLFLTLSSYFLCNFCLFVFEQNTNCCWHKTVKWWNCVVVVTGTSGGTFRLLPVVPNLFGSVSTTWVAIKNPWCVRCCHDLRWSCHDSNTKRGPTDHRSKFWTYGEESVSRPGTGVRRVRRGQTTFIAIACTQRNGIRRKQSAEWFEAEPGLRTAGSSDVVETSLLRCPELPLLLSPLCPGFQQIPWATFHPHLRSRLRKIQVCWLVCGNVMRGSFIHWWLLQIVGGSCLTLTGGLTRCIIIRFRFRVDRVHSMDFQSWFKL